MTKRFLIGLAALALAGFGPAACGDDSSSTTADEAAAPAEVDSGGEGDAIDVAADPSGGLAFTETELTAKAGSDTIDFDNESSTGHSLYVEDADGNVVTDIDEITGTSETATADLQPGTYTFYCDVPGHREAGMEGTITVK